MRAALCESTIAVRSIAIPFAFGIDEKQRQPVALAGRAAGARRDDQEIGGMAVDHKRLRAAQLETVAGTHRLQVDLQRTMFCALVDRERREQRAVRNPRQMRGLLRLASAARQSGRREHGGCEKRRRHQGAADFLHHHAGLDAAEPAAAEILRHQQAGKAHLGKRLPEIAGEVRWRPWHRAIAADATPAPCR